MTIVNQIKQQVRRLKTELQALYLAYQDPRVPWYAKVLIACVVGYALSPIDLIPDWIPILGYLDDLLIVPLGIVLILKIIPPAVMRDCRTRAKLQVQMNKPTNWVAAGIILGIWITLAIAILYVLLRPA